MATYYGGETLYDVIHTVTTVSTTEESQTTIYTVPTGYYALLKFAYLERDDNPINGAADSWPAFFSCFITVVGDDSSANFASGDYLVVSMAQQSWSTHKKWYSPNPDLASLSQDFSPYNLFLSQGDIIKIRRGDSTYGTVNMRYVLDLHLFKSP